jgi:uncharacterized protein (DUF433 family)
MVKFDHIVANPDILGGKPCVKDTRISVDFILELLASGASIPQIATNYASLSPEAIKEAILYASHFMQNDIIIETRKVA